MTDPFDELEGQLRARVSDRRAGPANAPSRRPRRRLRLGRGPLFALVGALSITGGALAATSLKLGSDGRAEGRRIVRQAVLQSVDDRACETKPAPEHIASPPPTANVAVLPAIRRALPWTGTPPTGAEKTLTDALVRKMVGMRGGPLVAGSAHGFSFGPDVQVLISVEDGAGIFKIADPRGCQRVREAHADARSAGRPEGVRHWVRDELARMDDTSVDAQTLTIQVSSPVRPGRRHSGSWAGSGMTLAPGARGAHGKVPLGGVLTSGSNRYVGLAEQRAVRLLVRPVRRGQRSRVKPSVAIQSGVWLVDLPPLTGPVRLIAVDAAGAVVHRMKVRG